MKATISYAKSKALLQQLAGMPGFVWNWEKGVLCISNPEHNFSFKFPEAFPHVPLILPASRYDGNPRPAVSFSEYVAALPELPPAFLLVLIQAGHAAIGFFEDGEVKLHKVVKKYMVRGNGKSQINYLSSRGKSKAGSRVRLANTVRFFEDINEKLHEWACHEAATHIFVSCPVKIQPLWFDAEPEPPFGKHDTRIRKVPLDVDRPDLEELLHVARLLCSGTLEGELPKGINPGPVAQGNELEND